MRLRSKAAKSDLPSTYQSLAYKRPVEIGTRYRSSDLFAMLGRGNKVAAKSIFATLPSKSSGLS
jgi:hypothetical protein